VDPDVLLARARDIVADLEELPSNREDLLAELVELFVALDEWLTAGGFPPAAWPNYGARAVPAGLGDAAGGYGAAMTEENAVPQTEVSVEQPAKVTTTTQVDAAPETAGPAEPDAVTENLEAEPKQ
jgi:hypothetical protein